MTKLTATHQPQPNEAGVKHVAFPVHTLHEYDSQDIVEYIVQSWENYLLDKICEEIQVNGIEISISGAL